MSGSTLDANEIDALMQAMHQGLPGTESKPVRRDEVAPYDLTSHDRIIRGQMPTLDSINDVIASRLGSGLQGRLRSAVRCTAHPATLMKFVDFSVLLAPPATVAVMSLGPACGEALTVLDGTLTRALLTGALGDKKLRPDGAAASLRRELTPLEKLVLRRVLCVLTDGLRDAWSAVLPLKPDILRFEADPRLAMVAAPNDLVILNSFDVELAGTVTGALQIGLPFAAVESVKKQLTSPPRVPSNADDRFSDAFARELLHVDAELIVELGRTRVALDDLMTMEPGQVLPLDCFEDSPVRVLVQGRAKLAGEPCVSHSRVAVKLRDANALPEETGR